MIKISNITRSFDILEALNECNIEYAYIDYPANKRFVFSSKFRRLGYFRIYVGCQDNVMSGYGDALIGHQDTTQTLINRALSKLIEFDEPIDMSNQFCP